MKSFLTCNFKLQPTPQYGQVVVTIRSGLIIVPPKHLHISLSLRANLWLSGWRSSIVSKPGERGNLVRSRSNQGSRFPAFLPAGVQDTDLLRAHSLLQQELTLRLERTGRADAHTLSAQHAGRFGDAPIEEGADLRLESSSVKIDRKGVLRIVRADLHAAPAQQAFRVIAYVHRVVVFDLGLTALRLWKAIDICTTIPPSWSGFRGHRTGPWWRPAFPGSCAARGSRVRCRSSPSCRRPP